MDEQEIERRARRRAGAKMGWYVHATVYILVNLMFTAVAYSHGRGWHFYPAMAWGFGLAIHGMVVFFLSGGTSFHERLVDRERERIMRERSAR